MAERELVCSSLTPLLRFTSLESFRKGNLRAVSKLQFCCFNLHEFQKQPST